MSLPEGAVVGNYQILGKLGEGGMGAVYRAVDTMIHREVAIKVLRPEIASQPDVLERFRSEAVLLAKLNHSSIAQLYAFFGAGDRFYMVMEYVAGDTFEHVIQQGAMEWQKAFAHLIQILDGIGHAHSAGILHRDLKPANVMLTPAGKIKLMDFGIAQALGSARMTRQGRIIGTLEYLAPERIQGKPADSRSDLYSVGVMLYEMLTGRLPFQSDSEYELLQQQIQQPPPRLSLSGIHVPPEVEAVVQTAMAKDPAQRYADAEEFAAALSALLPARKTGSRTIPIPPPVVAAPQADGSKGPSLLAKPQFWITAAGALVVLAVGIVFAALRGHQPVPAVKVADANQQQLYQPPPSQPLSVDTTPVIITPPPSREPVPSATVPKQESPAPKPVRAAPKEPAPQAPPAPEPTPVAVQAPPPPVVERPVVAPRPSIVRVSDARSIYVTGVHRELDGYIRDEIKRQMGVRLRLAGSIADADVVMRISVEEQKGSRIAQAGRLFGVKDHATVQAVIVDPRTSHIIWQQAVGDRKLIIGSFRGDPVRRLAERIVKELRESYNR